MLRPNPYKREPGGIVEKEMPIHVSNLMVVCPACAKPTRVAYRYEEKEQNGQKKRSASATASTATNPCRR